MNFLFLVLGVFFFTGACEKSGSGLKKKTSHCVDFCSENTEKNSVVLDERCIRLKIQAGIKGKAAGFCYDGPLYKGWDKEAVDPDPEACRALRRTAQKECDALPPDPKSEVSMSDSAVYKAGKLISLNGMPLCPCLEDQKK